MISLTAHVSIKSSPKHRLTVPLELCEHLWAFEIWHQFNRAAYQICTGTNAIMHIQSYEMHLKWKFKFYN